MSELKTLPYSIRQLILSWAYTATSDFLIGRFQGEEPNIQRLLLLPQDIWVEKDVLCSMINQIHALMQPYHKWYVMVTFNEDDYVIDCKAPKYGQIIVVRENIMPQYSDEDAKKIKMLNNHLRGVQITKYYTHYDPVNDNQPICSLSATIKGAIFIHGYSARQSVDCWLLSSNYGYDHDEKTRKCRRNINASTCKTSFMQKLVLASECHSNLWITLDPKDGDLDYNQNDDNCVLYALQCQRHRFKDITLSIYMNNIESSVGDEQEGHMSMSSESNNVVQIVKQYVDKIRSYNFGNITIIIGIDVITPYSEQYLQILEMFFSLPNVAAVMTTDPEHYNRIGLYSFYRWIAGDSNVNSLLMRCGFDAAIDSRIFEQSGIHVEQNYYPVIPENPKGPVGNEGRTRIMFTRRQDAIVSGFEKASVAYVPMIRIQDES